MRIAYIVDFLRTLQAGTEGQLAHLLRAFSGKGWKVDLLAIQPSPFLLSGAAQELPGVDITVLGGSSDLVASLPAFCQLYRRLRSSRPDLVHTFFPASNSVGVLAARLAGVRTVISSRRDMGYGLTGKDVALLRLADKFVSVVLCNAAAIRDMTIARELIPPGKIRVIYNGLGPSDGDSGPGKEQHPPVVGIVANLNRTVKRVDVFIDAAALVKGERPETRFQVIGDGPLRRDLESQASRLGIKDAVDFLGRRSDVQQLLPGLTVGVLSSDSEGLSNSLIEYMRSGLPVVATNVGGNSEIVEEGRSGLLVPAGDAKALALAILRLLRDSATAAAMGAAARERATSLFSLEGMLGSTESLYRELCRARGREC